MLCRVAFLGVVLTSVVTVSSGSVQAQESTAQAVVVSKNASFCETLAAKEIRRYLYLTSGRLLPIVEDPATVAGGVIVTGSKGRPVVEALLAD